MEDIQRASEGFQELLQKALLIREQAYAPYSQFKVGAALRTVDGKVFVGANIENVSVGLTVCAERNAIMQALLAGGQQIKEILIVADATPPAPPCGMCRQVMVEFVKDCQIIMVNLVGEMRRTTLAELLPMSFNRPI